MVARASVGGPTGALGIISGFVSNGATWSETIELSQNEVEVPDADTGEWRFTFRTDPSSVSALTLSTTDGTLTITQNTTYTTVAILCPPASMASMCGDYHADLAHKAADNTITHWGHGIVTFQDDPIWTS